MSFNIVEIFPHTVVDLILQHLDVKEVLAATQVHSSWNNFMSTNSLTCWKDVCVQPKLSDDLTTLVNSVRRFEHLKAVNISTIVPQLLEIVTKPGRKWKSIVIFRTNFEKQSQLETILRVASKSIERLELSIIGFLPDGENPETKLEAFNFTKLKKLNVSYHFYDKVPWINCMFKSTPQLKSLLLGYACDQHIKELILNSTRLRKLSLVGRFYDVNFFKDLSHRLPSRIESFDFNDILSSSGADENLSHFNNFFTSQSRTLQKFETDALLELEELKSAFKMPNFTTLNIRGFYYNPALMTCYLEEMRVTVVPEAKLKEINVQYMDQNLLEMLAHHARGLEVLRADDLMALNASNPAWFPKLQTVQVFMLHPNLKKLIIDKEVGERSRFEQMILDGIVTSGLRNHFSEENQELMDLDILNGIVD